MPELVKIQSGLLVDYRAGELIDAEHAYISISVGCTGRFTTAQDSGLNFRTLREPMFWLP